MRELNAVLGFYVPSFFMAKINTRDRLDSCIEYADQITLLHEYVHFVDDISTSFGLINFCNNIDMLKNIIGRIYESQVAVEVPMLLSDLSESQRENFELFKHYNGDCRYESLYGDCNVVEIIKRDIVTQVQKNNFSTYTIKVDKGGVEELFYRFGSVCVSESLAHIVEEKFSRTPVDAISFPYDSAKLVVGKLYPSLASNPLNIAALCETALMTYNPGETFINALFEMKKAEFAPESHSEVYDFVNASFAFEDALKIENIYSEILGAAVDQANDIFTVPELSHCSQLLVEYFEKAHSVRRQSPLLITDLINGATLDQVNENFTALFSQVGLPFLFNDDGMCFVDAKSGADNAVQYCHAVKAIFDMISSRKKSCDMSDVCSKSDNDMKMDHNCFESPWRRSAQGNLCPVGALWHSWGLDGKELVPL